MKKWLKRIRGALGMGLTWAAAWSGIGAIFGLVLWVGGSFPQGSVIGSMLFFALFGGASGLICGAAFSVALGIAGRRRRFDEMSLPRFYALGGVGGLLVTGAFVTLGMPLFSFEGAQGATLAILMGAASAGGSLRLARWADDRALLEAGADVADIGLTEEEQGALLGK